MTGWVFILTGVAGAIIPRNGWLRRILAVKGRPGAQPAAPDATPAEHETIEEYAGA